MGMEEKMIPRKKRLTSGGTVPFKGNRFCAAVLVLSMLFSQTVYALPQGSNVVSGTAAVSQPNSRTMHVNQSTAKAVINWQGFSIAQNEAVRFFQPSSSSVALNRVVGADPSHIYGLLSANGRVFVVNPNGLLIGPTGRIETAGFIGSTMNIANEDFLSGKYIFKAISGQLSAISNLGKITTSDGGFAALIAPSITNEGAILANLGKVYLASGEEVALNFAGNELISLVVNKAAESGSIFNSGLIKADGGMITLTTKQADNALKGIVNNIGVIEAKGITENNGAIRLEAAYVLQQGTVDAKGGNIEIQAQSAYFGDGKTTVENTEGRGGNIFINTTSSLDAVFSHEINASGKEGGNIYIDGGQYGRIMLSSTLLAKGYNAKGGIIEATAYNASLLGATVNADGLTEGGIIHWGGGWQGSGTLRHADYAFIGPGALISAKGQKGGEIVTWSKETTRFYGRADASDGGRIEVSSKNELEYKGWVNAGLSGSVLFDPKNLTLVDTLPDSLSMVKLAHGSSVGGGQTLSLANGDPFGSDGLGASVSLDGDRLAIGAYGDNTGGTNRGAVYLFNGVGTDYSGLYLRTKLAHGSNVGGGQTLSLVDYDDFGSGVSLDGDRLAIGSRGDNSQKGAVYLFNGVGIDYSGLYLRTKLAHGSSVGGGQTLSLVDISYFGGSVSLDGDRLAVGSNADDTGGANRGAVYLFNGVGADYSGLYLRTKIAHGSSVGGGQTLSLAASDGFGQSVSLDGDRLAVGASGNDTGGANRGAVYLFNGVGTDYSGLYLRSKLAHASSVGGGQTLSLADGDEFRSVSLDGDRLAVGAIGDNTGGANRGAVYLFTGVGTDYSGLYLRSKLAHGSSVGGGQTLSLADNDLFGSVSLDGDKLAVGASGDSIYRGAVYLFKGLNNAIFGLKPSDATFANSPSTSSYMRISDLTNLLNAGTNVTLQANNDITLSNAITVNNGAGNGGSLTLQAGRSLAFNANITTDNGNLIAKAGDSGANATYTDAGTPAITIANGVTLNIGTGSADLVAVNGNFINNSAAPFSTSGSGYWRVYSTNPANDTRGSLSPNFKQYNATYGSGVLGSGSGFLYSVAPSITPGLTGTASKTYDGNTTAVLASGNYTVSGTIDSDTVTLNNPASGTYDNKNAGTSKTVNVSGLSLASATNGSATVYGYSLSSTTASGSIGTITAASSATTALTEETSFKNTLNTIQNTGGAASGANNLNNIGSGIQNSGFEEFFAPKPAGYKFEAAGKGGKDRQ
ncbi:MAG: filamentous hemagglutinin N-terminal domain-containing protein [Nitrospirae bacterium]|nr:MAG: filamentous hemagglutinin N-terminal domain-containing protein [Nitrospirota bacterium]